MICVTEAARVWGRPQGSSSSSSSQCVLNTQYRYCSSQHSRRRAVTCLDGVHRKCWCKSLSRATCVRRSLLTQEGILSDRV